MTKTFALTALLLAANPALAQVQAQAPMQHDMPMPPTQTTTPNTAAAQAYKAANDKMMANMSRPLTGDADQDFVAGMLPHHQGAVDMAHVELQYGRDPALRRLARDIVKAQETEIAFMRRWQQQHPAAK